MAIDNDDNGELPSSPSVTGGEAPTAAAIPVAEPYAGPTPETPSPPVDGNASPTKTLDELRAELVAAATALETAKANLANEKEHGKLDLEIGKIVADYRSDYPAVKLADDDLQGFVADERKQLEAILSPGRVQEIGRIATAERKKIDDARSSIRAATDKLAKRQTALVGANADRDVAKATLDRWKKPAASIKERLKALEAF